MADYPTMKYSHDISVSQDPYSDFYQQILQRDEEGKEKAPEVVKEEMDGTKASANADMTTFANLLALGQMENIAAGGHGSDPVTMGHKYGVPGLPLASNLNFKRRYDPVVNQVTNLIMKHGKKSVAQRVGSSVPTFLFCVQLLRRTTFYKIQC